MSDEISIPVGTMTTLVDDLLRKPPNPLRDELVRNALAGKYHDFKTMSATPKVDLVADLERFGYRDLARKAMRGDYDDEPDDADDAAMAKLIASDPELTSLWERMQTTDDPVKAAAMIRDHMGKVKP